VIQPRHDRYVEAGEWIVPDLRDVMSGRSWTEQGACVGEIELFEMEGENPHHTTPRLSSASDLLRLLYCRDCTVRVQCLRDALTPPLVPILVDAEAESGNGRASIRGERNGPPRVWGVWGGTLERDRILTAGLRIDERIELLEATLPERLRLRTEAWRQALRARSSVSKARVNPRDRLVAAIVGEPLPAKGRKKRRPKLFTVGGRGGPGRGHRSKIGSYADAEGISYATAWRRVKAS
jgi:hypothetical protein